MREEELGIEEDHATRSRVLEAGSLYISTFRLPPTANSTTRVSTTTSIEDYHLP